MTESWLRHLCTASLNPYDIDKYLTGTLMGINQMADKAAFEHIRMLGISAEKMLERKLAWVLFQKDFSMPKDLLTGERYTIQTEICGKDKLFTYRIFDILDRNDILCVHIKSSWLLFDLQSRSMLRDYPVDLAELIEPGNSAIDKGKLNRIKTMELPASASDTQHRVGYFDLDANGHVSNQALLRLMAERLPYRLLEDNRIHACTVQFRTEAFVADLLRFSCDTASDDTTARVSCLKDNTRVGYAEFRFAERQKK